MNRSLFRWCARHYPLLFVASGIMTLLGVYLMTEPMINRNTPVEQNVPHLLGTTSPPRFRIIDLGTLGGSTYGSAINNEGQVIGTSSKPGVSAGLIFLWEKGHIQEIGTLTGKTASIAGDINSKGQIVGSADNGGNPPFDLPQALISRDGKIELLFPDGRESEAVGINEQGAVVGRMAVKKNVHHAFLWSNGTVTDLGTLQGRNSSAADINAASHIVGYSEVGRQNPHAFLWKEGKMQDLGTLGGEISEARAINDNAQVVGYAETEVRRGGSPQCHAFLWENGTMSDLGSPGRGLCSALDINNRGQIVGCWSPEDGNPDQWRALLWEDRKMFDLNDLISPNSGWVLQWASGINEQGQIVGTGMYQGRIHAFLLMPE